MNALEANTAALEKLLEANTAALERLTDAITKLTLSFREALDDLDKRVTVLENARDRTQS